MRYVFVMDCYFFEEESKNIFPVCLEVRVGKIAECFLRNVFPTF